MLLIYDTLNTINTILSYANAYLYFVANLYQVVLLLQLCSSRAVVFIYTLHDGVHALIVLSLGASALDGVGLHTDVNQKSQNPRQEENK